MVEDDPPVIVTLLGEDGYSSVLDELRDKLEVILTAFVNDIAMMTYEQNFDTAYAPWLLAQQADLHDAINSRSMGI